MPRFDGFWDVMCDYRDYIWMGIMVLIFFFVLLVISLILVEPGTAAFYVSLANFAIIVVLGVAMGGMFWNCLRRETDFYAE